MLLRMKPNSSTTQDASPRKVLLNVAIKPARHDMQWSPPGKHMSSHRTGKGKMNEKDKEKEKAKAKAEGRHATEEDVSEAVRFIRHRHTGLRRHPAPNTQGPWSPGKNGEVAVGSSPPIDVRMRRQSSSQRRSNGSGSGKSQVAEMQGPRLSVSRLATHVAVHDWKEGVAANAVGFPIDNEERNLDILGLEEVSLF